MNIFVCLSLFVGRHSYRLRLGLHGEQDFDDYCTTNWKVGVKKRWRHNNKYYPNFFFFWLCDPTRVMASSFLRFLDYTQRRTTVGRTTLDEWSALRRDLYLTTHNTHNRQTSMPSVGFEPMISAGERPQTYALDSAATGTGTIPTLAWKKSANPSKIQQNINQRGRSKVLYRWVEKCGGTYCLLLTRTILTLTAW